MSVISKKVCLIGDFSVGKTSLIRRFVDRQFSDRYLSTVGVKISRKLIDCSSNNSGKKIQLQLLIWDIEGRTKFKSIAPTYLQGAKGVIVVADVNRQETVARIQDHIDLFASVNKRGFKSIIAFNKSDTIESEKLEKILQQNQFSDSPQMIDTYATSAKTGKNVDIIFEKLARSIIAET